MNSFFMNLWTCARVTIVARFYFINISMSFGVKFSSIPL